MVCGTWECGRSSYFGGDLQDLGNSILFDGTRFEFDRTRYRIWRIGTSFARNILERDKPAFGRYFSCWCRARLQEICRVACQNGLQGFEFLEGIPGTLGGALRMNAGAMGWETFDLVEWVRFLLPDGSIREIPGTDLEVGYRYCKEAYEGIALRAKLKAEGRSDHRAIRKVIDKLASQRRATQPREASAGYFS